MTPKENCWPYSWFFPLLEKRSDVEYEALPCAVWDSGYYCSCYLLNTPQLTLLLKKISTEDKTLWCPLTISMYCNMWWLQPLPLFQIIQGYSTITNPNHILVHRCHHHKNHLLLFEMSRFIYDIYFEYAYEYFYYLMNILCRKDCFYHQRLLCH